MARSLAFDVPRATTAAFALALTAFAPGAVGQIGAIVAGAAAGLTFCNGQSRDASAGGAAPPVPRLTALICLAAFFALLVLAFLPGRGAALAFLAAVYRSGALVFGGGHVVLPLLQGAVVDPGYIGQSAFLAGYGAAQAMPGPLFTFAAFLGAATSAPPGGASARRVRAGRDLRTRAAHSWSARCRYGAKNYWPPWRTPQWPASTPLSSVFSPPRFTIPSGRAPCGDRLISLSSPPVSSRWSSWRAPPLAVVVLTAIGGVALSLAGR